MGICVWRTVAVGEGVAVGVFVGVVVTVARAVAVAVAVAVGVGTPPPLALVAMKVTPAITRTAIANRPAPSPRLIWMLRMRLHGRSTLDLGGSSSSIVSIAEGATCSCLSWVGMGDPNSAWCISAILWNR